MKKHIILIIAILFSFQNSAEAQGAGVIGLPELNVLYRGYPNKVKFGMSDGSSNFTVKGDGVTMHADSSISRYYKGDLEIEYYEQFYVVKPTTSGRHCTLYFLDATNGDTIGVHEFRVMNLPAPTIYFGTVASGESISAPALNSMSRFFAKYPPEIPLKASFTVTSWEISKADSELSYSGSGAVITEEAKEFLRTFESGDKCIIKAKYKGMGYAGNMLSEIKIK